MSTIAVGEDWRVLIAETLSGQIVADVTPASMPSFSRSLSEAGELSVTVRLGASPNQDLDWHAYTRPGLYSWALLYGTYVVQAGPVWSYQVSDENRELSVSCGGLYSIFDRRVTRNPSGSAHDVVPAIVNPSEDLIYRNLTLPEIMRRLVADNLAQGNAAIPSLILPEADDSPGGHERTYYGYDLKMIQENMDQLAEVQNGPEFDFAPELAPDGAHIQWRLRIGTPQLGAAESLLVWDYGTEAGPVDTIDVDVDGSQAPAHRVWVKGDGTERGLLTGFAADPSWHAEGYPLTDYVDSDHTSVTRQDTLESYADAYLAEFARPTETWSMSVHIAGRDAAAYSAKPGQWNLGDAPLFAVTGHPWLSDGMYRRRILGYSDDGAYRVSLDLAETPESGT